MSVQRWLISTKMDLNKDISRQRIPLLGSTMSSKHREYQWRAFNWGLPNIMWMHMRLLTFMVKWLISPYQNKPRIWSQFTMQVYTKMDTLDLKQHGESIAHISSNTLPVCSRIKSILTRATRITPHSINTQDRRNGNYSLHTIPLSLDSSLDLGISWQ